MNPNDLIQTMIHELVMIFYWPSAWTSQILYSDQLITCNLFPPGADKRPTIFFERAPPAPPLKKKKEKKKE